MEGGAPPPCPPGNRRIVFCLVPLQMMPQMAPVMHREGGLGPDTTPWLRGGKGPQGGTCWLASEPPWVEQEAFEKELGGTVGDLEPWMTLEDEEEDEAEHYSFRGHLSDPPPGHLSPPPPHLRRHGRRRRTDRPKRLASTARQPHPHIATSPHPHVM